MKKLFLVMLLIMSVMSQSLAMADGGRRSSSRDRHDRRDHYSNRDRHHDRRDRGHDRDEISDGVAYAIVGVAALATILNPDPVVVVGEGGYSQQSGHWEEQIVGYRTAYKLVRHPAEYGYVCDSRGRRHRVIVRQSWEEEVPYQVAVTRRVWVPDYPQQ